MPSQLRWGILGTGNIARQFSQGVLTAKRSQLVAVASRNETTAQSFAAEFSIPAAHGSYQALLNDPQVQAVYISLPNAMHHPWTLASLRAGKHVLCEKPIAMTVDQATEMFELAEKSGLILMEAYMYRCHPQTQGVLEKLRGGAIGQLRVIRTSFCFRTRKIQGNVRFSPELGGGVMMDVGCYCIDFSRLCAGVEPKTALVSAHKHDTGVDDMAVGHLDFDNGVLASFTCGMDAQADNTAYLLGTDGYIEIPVPWKPPALNAEYRICTGTPPRMDQPAGIQPGAGGHESKSALPAAGTPALPPAIAATQAKAADTTTNGTAPILLPPRQSFFVHAGGSLYGIEADAFAEAVLDGQKIPVTRDDSLGTMRILQNLREQIHGPWTS